MITGWMVLSTVTGMLLVWVEVLTVVVWRRCREPWADDGRPVYQRMPDGRIRFSWGMAHALGQAQRQHATQAVDQLASASRPRPPRGADGLDGDTGPIISDRPAARRWAALNLDRSTDEQLDELRGPAELP